MRASFPLIAAITLTVCAGVPRIAASAAEPARLPASAGPDLFGSVGLKLGANRYSERWRRVTAPGASAGLGQLVEAARTLQRPAQAQFVNAALNRSIRYRFDTDPSGERWATPRETLSRGFGDCEDYAIAKMHALRRLGVAPGDLFMTIGHDAAAGAAHAVLVVRANGRFFVLDNRTDRLIPEQGYGDFYPILSFSAAGGSWLHGYRRGQTPAAVKMMSEIFAQGRHVPLGSSEASRRRLAG